MKSRGNPIRFSLYLGEMPPEAATEGVLVIRHAAGRETTSIAALPGSAQNKRENGKIDPSRVEEYDCGPHHVVRASNGYTPQLVLS